MIVLITRAFLLMFFFCCNSAYAQSAQITLNPTRMTPLSALYKTGQTNQESITIVLKGKDEDDMAIYFPEAYGTEFPIHGLYSEHTNTLTIQHGSSRPKVYQIAVGKILITNKSHPSEKPSPKTPISLKAQTIVDTFPKNTLYDQDFYFTGSPNGHEIMGFDRKGNLRYLYQNVKEKPTLMRMEHDDKNVYFLYTSDNKVYLKRDLMGNIVFRQKMDAHHESTPYENGEELILGNSRWGWEDAIFLLGPDKKIKRKLLIGDVLRRAISVEDQALLKKLVYDDKNILTNKGKPRRIDWAHANSLVYDSDQKMLYISLRHQGVLAIKLPKLELEWFLANETLKTGGGFAYGKKPEDSLYLTDIPSLQKYRLSILNEDAPKGQHSLLIKKNGNLLMFDNRSNGAKNTNGSRVIEYQIDPKNRRAYMVNVFQDRTKTYSRYVGDVDLTGDNLENWLIFYGNHNPKKIYELDPWQNILFHMEFPVPGIWFRVEKFPLYPYRSKDKKYSADYTDKPINRSYP